MFKRANKVTALLVAAASIMSVVPAMASEHLGDKDGTVRQGISYGDGSYSYYGYRTDDDDTGIWYNKGGDAKDSRDSDLEDYIYDNAAKYGDKYAIAHLDSTSNDDEYLIDLSTGKKLDDDKTATAFRDDAKSALQSALKKAERYNGLQDLNNHNKVTIDDNQFDRVLTGQFGEVWYQYTTKVAAGLDEDFTEADGTTTTSAACVVFTNDDAKYIDVSYEANMYVYSSKKKRAIKIENYDKKNDDAALEVHLEDIKVLAQDKSYLYTLTHVRVVDSSSEPSAKKAPEHQYFIQKISKARDGKKDGAYLPKSTDSYQLNVGNTIYDNGDSKDAYRIMENTDKGNTENIDGYDADNNLYAVKDGALYVTSVKSDKAKVYTIKLAKVKVDSNLDSSVDHVDTYLAKKSDDDDHDVDGRFGSATVKADETSKTLNTGVSIDVNGNTWVLNNGKIYKYTDGSFKEMFNTDHAMDTLDVYDDGNLMAFDYDDGTYTVVKEGRQQTIDEAKVIDPNLTDATTTTAHFGWVQEAAGWTFYDVSGNKTANYWALDNGRYYWIGADGFMKTGWQQDTTGTWYYLNPTSGAMPLGAMYSNQWVQYGSDWYYMGASGAMATNQWVQSGSAWYYVGSTGAMLTNTTVGGYTLGADGAWV